ncbi:MAG: putative 6-phospho-beta-glucosidase [candidate division WS2 bacterium]|nr:putative 6-phospho-beta-glucosidase [Candidatus Psychracetigena formicireducens]
MKIAILGGGGTRTPLLFQGLINLVNTLGLKEISLMDIDEKRLMLMGKVINSLLIKSGVDVKVPYTQNLEDCLRDSSFVINTIRVGGEHFRILDEKVPLKYGLIGQETVGPGGFAMAVRTIPVVLKIAESIHLTCPDAWLINFSNPSGIITQAIYTHSSHQKVVGICDVPSSIKDIIAKISGKKEEEIYLDYFGLNHLGWIKGVYIEGKDYLKTIIKLISNYPDFEKLSGLPLEFVQKIEMLPNPYLYYYHFTDKAYKEMKDSQQTRGERVRDINLKLFEELEKSETPIDVYNKYINKREEKINSLEIDSGIKMEEGKGYVEVALKVIRGLSLGGEIAMVNTPNQGSICGLNPDDIVEVPVYIGKNLIRPFSTDNIPKEIELLINQVKSYEREIVEGVSKTSYDKLVSALAKNPLVPSIKIARKVVDEYIEVEKEYFSIYKNKTESYLES